MQQGGRAQHLLPLQADLDEVAKRVVAALNCDVVILSFETAAGLAFSETATRTGPERGSAQRISTSLCRRPPFKSDKPLSIEDARSNAEFKGDPDVNAGGVVGYLGMPIRQAESGAQGAISAITSAPRAWTEAEKQFLSITALCIEAMILKEMFRSEASEANRLLTEYDHVVSAFALVRAAPTSIHDRSGTLVYSNRELSAFVHSDELEGAAFRSALLAKPLPVEFGFRAYRGVRYRIRRHQTDAGFHVCQWRYEAPPVASDAGGE